MAPRPRKTWSYSVGRYGASVRLYEPRLGAPLRWDYRTEKGRERPEVHPLLRIRQSASAPTDPVRVREAEDLCNRKAAELTLEPLRRATDPEALTVGMAYALYFDPRRRALPTSRSARVHHTASRTFWTAALGEHTAWDALRPADLWAALLELQRAGRVATAEKRHDNLRTLSRWLRERMGYDQLRNPLRGLDKRKLLEGYKPRRPRYTRAEVEKLVTASAAFGERFQLFVVLMADSGARAVQVRHAMRSGLDCELEPPPPTHPPHGWIALPAVKGQEEMVTFLTARQRAALTAAVATYPPQWEVDWLERRTDYPLIPGGRTDHKMVPEPISDTALRHLWTRLEKKAEVPRRARLAFHGARRSWADDIEEAEGLDTVTAAGGWSRRETPEELYVSRRKYGHLEKARKRRERE